MSEWGLNRKFWNDVSVKAAGDGYSIYLDDRVLKTPSKVDLRLPTRALADLVAGEWAAVEKAIDPQVMPFTRLSNAAHDRMGDMIDDVVKMLTEYGATDLVCYRAAGPEGLVALQARTWDPMLKWASEVMDVRLVSAVGVVPVPQPADSLARITQWLDQKDPFDLMALHELVTISGSMVLAMAFCEGRIDADALWKLSRVDNDWQISQWGEDEEEASHARKKRADLMAAATMWAALRSKT